MQIKGHNVTKKMFNSPSLERLGYCVYCFVVSVQNCGQLSMDEINLIRGCKIQ